MDTGRAPSGQALAVPAKPASGLDASRCDPSREDVIFAYLCRKYVQRADSRQREMGLQYTTAETRDLARVIDWLMDELDESCKHGIADWRDCPTCTLREKAYAIAMEARQGGDGEAGSVHDSAAIAQPTNPTPQSDERIGE